MLFNLHVNKLIVKLQESGYGCKLWGFFAGCILYADDILLISSPLIKLQAMLEICFNFGYDNDLLFNAKKSAYFAAGDLHLRASKAEMYIGEEKIKWVSVCSYLGISVYSGKLFRTDCEERQRKFGGAINAIISHNVLSEECYMHILITQCVPILMYGASVWSCARESLRRKSVSFNDAVRKIFHYNR